MHDSLSKQPNSANSEELEGQSDTGSAPYCHPGSMDSLEIIRILHANFRGGNHFGWMFLTLTAGLGLHQVFHIRRNAASTSAAYCLPSISGDDLHPLPQARAKLGKPGQIAGPVRRRWSTYCSGVSGDQLGQAHVRQDAHSPAAHRRAAGQGDDRNAHPERIERAGVAVVGERDRGPDRGRDSGWRYSSRGTLAANSTRSAAMPPSWNSARTASQVTAGLRLEDQARAGQRLEGSSPTAARPAG